jgi:PPK2 family polyphosphate:nucleotide phosphotransferase
MYVTRLDKMGVSVKLNDISSDPPKGISRQNAQQEFDTLGEELFDLQDLLWGARTHSVLVVLQGRDSAGKDGAVKHVVGCLNPRGVHVTSFGIPSHEEAEHDFLWRIHKQIPRKGEFAIFNRSHYEDVLVARVHELVPESLWKERYGHIRDFEELLAEHDTIVLKYFLHISSQEQEKRLRERELDAVKAWKINAGDWKDREKWDDYTEAYEAAISRTAAADAPWFVVPADSKWFRNLAIAHSIVDALRPHKKAWQEKLDADGRQAKAELLAYRNASDRGHRR